MPAVSSNPVDRFMRIRGLLRIAAGAFAIVASAGAPWAVGSTDARADCGVDSEIPCILASDILLGCADTVGCNIGALLAVGHGETVVAYSLRREGREVRMLAEWKNGWTHTPVDSSGATTPGTALAIGADGRTALAYFGEGGDLVVAQRMPGQTVFAFSRIASAGASLASPSLAVIRGGIAVAYSDLTHGALRYAERITGGKWTTVVIDAQHHATGTSLVASGSARAIAYYDSGHGDLRIAMRRSGHWTSRVVDAGGRNGGSPSMAGNPVRSQLGVAYCGGPRRQLKLASLNDGRWTTTVVDSTEGSGESCALVLDGASTSDSLAIAYSDAGRSGLKLARKQRDWSRDVVDAEPGSSQVSCVRAPLPGYVLRLAYLRAGAGLMYVQSHPDR